MTRIGNIAKRKSNEVVINIVSPHASHYLGGMEVVTIEMARHLSAAGDTVRFFTRTTDNPSDNFLSLTSTPNPNLQVIEVPTSLDTPYPDGTWPTFYRISCDFGVASQPYYIQYSDADFFITHLSIDSLFVPKTSKNILHLHGSPTATDPLMESAVKIPIATIAHSHSIKKWWQYHFSQLMPSVFQNGIDTTFFSGDVHATRPIDVLYVGRFLDHKGIDDILHSIDPDVKLVIAGNGPMLPSLQKMVQEMKIEDNVTIYDTPPTPTIKELYKASKIFACPSRGKEGVLTTLLEAGASGCSVVTTSGSGMTDIIKHEVNGVVVSPGNIDELSVAIRLLLSDDHTRKNNAITLQDEIRKHWEWQSKILELRDIYRASI